MNLTARGTVEYVGTLYDPWAEEQEEHPSPWAATPDEEDSKKLDQWIGILPVRYREDLDLMRQGLNTADAARALGCSQPQAWLRREVAQDVLRWAVATLPILTPSLVYATVLEATQSVQKAEAASYYWMTWKTKGHATIKQGQLWRILFGVPPHCRSLTSVHRHADTEVGAVARALWALHDRPGFVLLRKKKQPSYPRWAGYQSPKTVDSTVKA